MTTTRHARRFLILLLAAAHLPAALGADPRYEIGFPDLSEYRTLACDLHMHTVFSDGLVWPTVRVAEAWRQGIDVIAITDHIEYQPHRDDVPTGHNRPYELALEDARAHDLLLVRGAEITRDTPPGHFNAVFLDDIRPVETDGFFDAVEEANRQGAFVFWNHQGWKGPKLGRWQDDHTTLFEKKWLHGMEVCNGTSYYADAHGWCLEKNLTMLGSSDIHEPDRLERSTPGRHRTMTLVFASDRTLPAVKESLLEGRTVVWYEGKLIGRRRWLESLFGESVQVEPPHRQNEKRLWVRIRNASALDIRLERSGTLGPARLTLPAGATSLVRIDTDRPHDRLQLEYTAANLLIAPGTGLPVTLSIPVDRAD